MDTAYIDVNTPYAICAVPEATIDYYNEQPKRQDGKNLNRFIQRLTNLVSYPA